MKKTMALLVLVTMVVATMLGCGTKLPSYDSLITEEYFAIPSTIDNDLGLPTQITVTGTILTVVWTSSNPSLLSNEGVIMVSQLASDTDVTLTATISNKSYTKTLDFTVTVLARSLPA